MTEQERFQDALELVSKENEFKWTIMCEPHEDHPARGESVAGVPITYQLEIAIREGASEGAIEQAFRIHFNQIHRDITGNFLGGDYKIKKDADGKAHMEFEKALPRCKRVVSCLTPKDVWTETTHLFSLRDPISQMGFDVFKSEHLREDMQTRYRITCAWGIEA